MMRYEWERRGRMEERKAVIRRSRWIRCWVRWVVIRALTWTVLPYAATRCGMCVMQQWCVWSRASVM